MGATARARRDAVQHPIALRQQARARRLLAQPNPTATQQQQQPNPTPHRTATVPGGSQRAGWLRPPPPASHDPFR